MTLTEEQRAALKRVIAYMNRMYGIASPYCGCTEDANILRAMIDSSGTVEPTGGFDLERARGLRDFLQDDCAEVGDIWGEMIAEIERLCATTDTPPEEAVWLSDLEEIGRGTRSGLIDIEIAKKWHAAYRKAQNSNLLRKQEIERLRASLIDLHAEYINTLEKNPECSAWDLDEQSVEDQRRLRKNAAHAISIVEPPIYLQAEQRATKIKELEDAHKRSGAKYAKIINELRSSVYANIPGLDVGKIGPDAKPRSWQITDERKAALSRAYDTVSWIDRVDSDNQKHIDVLRTMLEAGQ